MFNKFIKKTSSFFAILLTVLLVANQFVYATISGSKIDDDYYYVSDDYSDKIKTTEMLNGTYDSVILDPSTATNVNLSSIFATVWDNDTDFDLSTSNSNLILNSITSSNGNIINLGSGDINLNNSIFNNSSDIIANSMVIGESSVFLSNLENISVNNIENKGTLIANANGINNSEITGVGALMIDADVENATGKVITQTDLTINTDKSLIANVEDLAITNAITNNGTLTFNGNGINNNGISGAGALIIDADVENATGKVITQTDLTINADKSLTASIEDLAITNAITNDGILTFNEDGTTNNEILGTGALTLEGNIVIEKNITQSTITIGSNKTATVNDDVEVLANSLQGEDSATLVNNGKLVLNLSEENSYTLPTLTYDNGIAITSMTISSARVEMYPTEFTQKKLFVYGDGELLLSSAVYTSNVENNLASLEIAAILDGRLDNKENSTVSFLTDSYVSNEIKNAGTINILSSFDVDSIITGNAETVETNILNIGNDDNSAEVNVNESIRNQAITVANGSLIIGDSGELLNSSLTVNENGTVITDLDNITIVNNEINNDGTIRFVTSYGTNNNTINGTGTLEIGGEDNSEIGVVLNSSGTAINQKEILIKASDSSLIADASDLVTTDGILNNGSLYFQSEGDSENVNDITGTGELFVISGNLTNNGQISQSLIAVEDSQLMNAGSIEADMFEVDASTVTNSGTLTAIDLLNEGSITNNENATIEVTNEFFNDENGVIENSGEILVSSLTNSGILTNNENATIEVVNKLLNDENVDINNSGLITINDLENKGIITNNETGEIIVEGEAINDGMIINTDGGTISSQKYITNKGIISSNADGMEAEIFNIGSNSLYEITGGTVSYAVFGDNTGTVLINQSTVTFNGIVSQNNIDLHTGLILADETNIKTSTLTINDGAILNTQNDKIGTANPAAINIADNAQWKYELDVDLLGGQGDLLTNIAEVGIGSSALINSLNILTDKAQTTEIQIADGNINAMVGDLTDLYTTNVKYKVEARNEEDSSWLDITADGYGGLANAIYDGVNTYSITEDTDIVTAWIEEPEGTINNSLKNDLVINGNGRVLTTDTNLDGIDVNSKMLTATNISEYSNWNNAITVGEDGILRLTDINFTQNTGDAVIANNGSVVLSSVTFEGNDATIDIVNNSNLTLVKEPSVFEKGISGTGTTTIDGVAIDMGDATIAQTRINISDTEGSSLTANIDNLTDSTTSITTELIMNNGEVSLFGGDSSTLETQIKGFGNLSLSSGTIEIANSISQSTITISSSIITVADEAKIKADKVDLDENASLVVNADNIDTGNGSITNEGVLELTGGTNKNNIDGDNGLLNISGEVINLTGKSISQANVSILDSALFTANATDLVITNGVSNEGTLTFTGGTNNNEIIGAGDLIVIDSLINNGSISQNSIEISSGVFTNVAGSSITVNALTIAEGVELVTDISDIDTTAGEGIENNGILTLVSDSESTNNNVIVGDGILNITENTTVVNVSSITQSSLTIANGATLSTIGEILTIAEGIENNGTLAFNAGTEDTNSNDIIGLGSLVVTDSTTITNEGIIQQNNMSVEEGSSFETDVDMLTVVEGIENNGELIFTAGTNKNEITGDSGSLVIDGTVENKLATAISQDTLTITENGDFTANATDLVIANGVSNEGTLTFTGGNNINSITTESGNGILNVEDSLLNTATEINQKEININAGTFDNNRDSVIVSTTVTIADEAVLLSDAKDLTIETINLGSDSQLTLRDDDDAILSATITGDGLLNKQGAGIVELTGTNDYTGTTTISDGAISITSADNISENTIFMDGGALILNDNEIELANEITATQGNNINIETNISTVTLTNVINQSSTEKANLVKSGDGKLVLDMEENYYEGNTIVNEGVLEGTTKNIKGTLFGTGSNNLDTFIFTDSSEDVVLNEVDATDYIGTFNYKGSAQMTIENNFYANQALIENGTFVINNDSTMGGSGTDFTVDGTMKVTNSLLKGYGDIKVGDLIISDGATLAPGCSTTTFKVDGNLIFEENGTYDVEFSQLDMDKANDEQTNDKTTVSGTTTIDENAKITLNNLEGKYYVHETMNLIEAGTLADGVEYKLENVTFNDNDATDLRAGYDTRISTRVYSEGNTLKIDLERKASEYATATEFDRSHNENEAAKAIDAISTGNGGDITSALDTLEKFYYYESTYDTEALKEALNDVAGVIHANSTLLTFTNTKIEHVYDKIKERTLDLFPCTKFHDKVWAEYYYNTYQVNENENSPKFDTNVNGFLVGFDMISAKNWTMGVMAGYGTSELKEKSDKTTMNDINLGLYGGFENSKWLLKGMLLGGYEQYTTDRNVAFMDRIASSEHNGYSAALDLEAGYKISLNKDEQAKHKMYLKPFIGVTGQYINQESFKEKGAEDLNLKVESYDSITAQARLGLGINGKIKKFGWYAKAGVRQLLTDDYAEIETSLLSFEDETKMKIRSAELDKFSYGGGLGADYELSKAWTIFANGLASFADKSTNYYANVGLMYKFGCVNDEKKSLEEAEELSKALSAKEAEQQKLRKELNDKEKALAKAEEDLKNKEKELQDKIAKYEAKIVSEQQAQKMKEKTLKKIKLNKKPTFVFGKDKLTNSGKDSLKQVADELKQYPKDSEVLVEGYTDNVGSTEVNQRLSESRALAVATSLKKDYDIENTIAVIGRGSANPIASNATEAGRAKNRRVEITITDSSEESIPEEATEIK